MAMVNNTMVNLAGVSPAIGTILPNNVKDSRWLTLEVCREYQRNKCTRPDTECKFAHPPTHVEVQNGRVTACFDSIKGKCQRKDPPCKYLHPPQHLREQLLQNGRNNLILKNLQMQAAMQPMIYSPAGIPPQYVGQPVAAQPQPAVPFNPYVGVCAIPTSATGADGTVVSQHLQSVIPTPISTLASQQKLQRADRLEQNSVPAMIPYKRIAMTDAKTPMPMYQQPVSIAAYQQAIAAMNGQQYIPMNYGKASPTIPNGTQMYQPALSTMQLQQAPVTITGHPPSMPRF